MKSTSTSKKRLYCFDDKEGDILSISKKVKLVRDQSNMREFFTTTLEKREPFFSNSQNNEKGFAEIRSTAKSLHPQRERSDSSNDCADNVSSGFSQRENKEEQECFNERYHNQDHIEQFGQDNSIDVSLSNKLHENSRTDEICFEAADLPFETVETINQTPIDKWQEFERVLVRDFKAFRDKWRISIVNIRKNKEDSALYLKCQFKDCKVVYKTRVPQKDDEDHELIIFTKSVHNHKETELLSLTHRGLSKRIKEFIEPMIANNVKPKRVLKILQTYGEEGKLDKEELPSICQIKDYKKNLNRKVIQLQTEADFTNFLSEFDPDMIQDESAAMIIGKNLNPNSFCLVFSSKNLLKNIIWQASSSLWRYFCTDSTYKLTVLGYPVLVIGTQDANHKFRLIGIAVSKHEREEDFQFMFSSIKSFVKNCFDYEWEIDLIMSDASMSIFNASRSVFGNSHTHGMCSVHVWRNLNQKIAFYVPKESRKELKEDIKTLENISDKNVFDVGIALFERKWESSIRSFLDYFLTTWIDSRFSCWYRGSIPPGFSHTNNAIEGFNSGLKHKYTDWEKFKLSQFIQVLKEVIVDYSEATIKVPFPQSLSVDKKTWIKAQQMINDHFLEADTHTFYFAQLNGDKERKKVTKQKLDKYLAVKRSRNFNSFTTSNSLWKIEIGTTICSSACTCPKFRKSHYCKHIIVCLIKLNRITVPEEFSTRKVVEENLKRGRQSRAASALVKN